ncbi:Lrp/AsnC family transcriptional regulator [Gracilibacillus salinarum]|uniref:Lrp/AsnC family transcriptional regulator n=1 Tax=Gracilibacillus salinarum TaxID=2932255 RepID=A0ABY4GK30_9BACI|nr:Lrp/AsnC family transcriptional regulator [Gracilibacillus salinarum]UOQ84718.1 Lrp/AsnC family transcriptional regulator [Gracilibacillus salinarum]
MLDRTDFLIIDELSKNSRITMKELGEKVHLTGPAATARVEKLEDSGIIEGYSIQLNQVKMGYDIHAFLTIITQTINHQPYLAFLRTREQYVIHHYKISGDGCYLLECKFTSNEQMSHFLEDLNEYANYKLSIVIDEK